jgi:hypothetical protein
MNHNGGFPPIYEGGKKEIIQREFSAQNILSLNQIMNNQDNKNKVIIKRTEPITFNVIDKKPKFKK